MNAGAEYVLYRIWAALQDQKGIHAESLLTCVGALAGYSCQHCVRRTAALPGADAKQFELAKRAADDGTTYVEGEALNAPLADSPLSIKSFICRTVRKLGEAPPNLDDIVRHVTQTMGTSEFGVPRAPDGHRPRHLPMFYLKELWPHILPVAQRYCRKPAQLPMLFGIAIQRALEETQDKLHPTLGANLALESAVAMSRVALPDLAENMVDTAASTAIPAMSAAPVVAFPSMPATPPNKRKRAAATEPSRSRAASIMATVPPRYRIAAVALIAFTGVAGAMWKVDRNEAPHLATEVRTLQTQPVDDEGSNEPEPPSEDAATTPAEPPAEETQVAAVTAPPPAPEGSSSETWLNDDTQLQADSGSDGGAEMIPAN